MTCFGYPEQPGWLDRIQDWHLVHIVDAMRNLPFTAGAAAAVEVDWGI